MLWLLFFSNKEDKTTSGSGFHFPFKFHIVNFIKSAVSTHLKLVFKSSKYFQAELSTVNKLFLTYTGWHSVSENTP